MTTGSSALRSTWRRWMTESRKPLARAVLTKSSRLTSSIEGTRHARVCRHEEQADGRGRQDQVGSDVQRVGEPGVVRADRLIAEAWQPIHRHRKQQDGHQRHPEQGRGIEDQRQQSDGGVGPGAGKTSRQRAEQDAAARAKSQTRCPSATVSAGRRSRISVDDRHLLAKREARDRG